MLPGSATIRSIPLGMPMSSRSRCKGVFAVPQQPYFRTLMNLPIHITENDLQKLRMLLRDAKVDPEIEPENIKRLESELDRAIVVENGELPFGLVTMYTRAEMMDLTTGEPDTYTLVFPDDADIDDGRISVLAPLGTAMIGYCTGDKFEWPTPGGTIRYRVGRVLARNVR